MRAAFRGLTENKQKEIERRREYEAEYQQELDKLDENCIYESKHLEYTTPQDAKLHKKYICHTRGELYHYCDVCYVDTKNSAKRSPVVIEQGDSYTVAD